MDLYERTVSVEKIYEGKVLKLNIETVELPDGNYSKKEILKHPGGVAILAYTSEDTILLVEQFRKPIERVLFEIPAGKIEANEALEVCAMRELEEETGFKAKKMKYLGKIVTAPGYCDEYIHFYKAEELYKGTIGGDEDEFIQVHQLKIDRIKELIKSGEIIDGKTIAALMLLE